MPTPPPFRVTAADLIGRLHSLLAPYGELFPGSVGTDRLANMVQTMSPQDDRIVTLAKALAARGLDAEDLPIMLHGMLANYAFLPEGEQDPEKFLTEYLASETSAVRQRQARTVS